MIPYSVFARVPNRESSPWREGGIAADWIFSIIASGGAIWWPRDGNNRTTSCGESCNYITNTATNGIILSFLHIHTSALQGAWPRSYPGAVIVVFLAL